MSQVLAISNRSGLQPEILQTFASAREASGAFKHEYIGSRVIHEVFTELQERDYIKQTSVPLPANLAPLGKNFHPTFLCLRGLIAYAEAYGLDNDDGFAELANFAEGGQQFLTLKELQAITKKVINLTHQLFRGDSEFLHERNNINAAEVIHIPEVDDDHNRISAYRAGLQSIEAYYLYRDLHASRYKAMEKPVGFANVLAFHLASAGYAGDYQQLKQHPASVSLAAQESSFQARYVKNKPESKSLAAAAQVLEWLVFGSDDSLVLRSFYDQKSDAMDAVPAGYIAGVLNALIAGRRNSITEQERNMICIPGYEHRYDDDLQKQIAKCLGEGLQMIRKSSVDEVINQVSVAIAKSEHDGYDEHHSREVLAEFLDFLRDNFFAIKFGLVDMSHSAHTPEEIRKSGKFFELLGAYYARVEELRFECTESFMHEHSNPHREDVTATFKALYVGSKREGLVHDIGDAAAVVQMLKGQGAVRATG